MPDPATRPFQQRVRDLTAADAIDRHLREIVARGVRVAVFAGALEVEGTLEPSESALLHFTPDDAQPPPNGPVRVQYRGMGAAFCFYTAAHTHDDGRWQLDLPQLVQVLESRNAPRLAVADGRLELSRVEEDSRQEVRLYDLSRTGFAVDYNLARLLLGQGQWVRGWLELDGRTFGPLCAVVRHTRPLASEPGMWRAGLRFSSVDAETRKAMQALLAVLRDRFRA